jgi:hypothetical protein
MSAVCVQYEYRMSTVCVQYEYLHGVLRARGPVFNERRHRIRRPHRSAVRMRLEAYQPADLQRQAPPTFGLVPRVAKAVRVERVGVPKVVA